MKKFLVLINENSGGVSNLGSKQCISEIHKVLQPEDINIQIAGGDPSSLVEHARIAAQDEEYGSAIVLGGDGTIAAVAGALSQSDLSLAPLPGGTMNAFSRDLGYDADLLTAIKQLPSCKRQTVDIGFAGEYAFLNNVVFGAYTSVAASREHVRDVDGIIEKMEAMTEVIGAVAFSDTEKYRLSVDGEPETVETNTLMLANNIYEGVEDMRPMRSRIDNGVLGLYIANSTTPFDFLSVLFNAVSTGLEQSDLIEIRKCQRCRVASEGSILALTIDGEAMEIPSPIELSIQPKGLTVLAPGPA